MEPLQGVRGVVDEVGGQREDGIASPKRAPAPGGEPLRSTVRTATWRPAGVVSTRLPLPALAVTRCPFGARASPSGASSAPPTLTVRPRPALVVRSEASATADSRLSTVSAT